MHTIARTFVGIAVFAAVFSGCSYSKDPISKNFVVEDGGVVPDGEVVVPEAIDDVAVEGSGTTTGGTSSDANADNVADAETPNDDDANATTGGSGSTGTGGTGTTGGDGTTTGTGTSGTTGTGEVVPANPAPGSLGTEFGDLQAITPATPAGDGSLDIPGDDPGENPFETPSDDSGNQGTRQKCERFGFVSDRQDGKGERIFRGDTCLEVGKTKPFTETEVDPTLHRHYRSLIARPDGKALAATTFLTEDAEVFGTLHQILVGNPDISIWHDGMRTSAAMLPYENPVSFRWNGDGSKFAVMVDHDLPIPIRAIRVGTDPFDATSGNSKVVLMRLSGESIRDIAWGAGNFLLIAMSQGDNKRSDLYVLDLDDEGAVPYPLEGADHDAHSEEDPSVSADGKHLVFVRSQQIWTCDLNIYPVTGRLRCDYQRQLTMIGSGKNETPCFTADGKSILFASDRKHDGATDREIWKMKVDGSEPINLTNDPGDDHTPVCVPRPMVSKNDESEFVKPEMQIVKKPANPLL